MAARNSNVWQLELEEELLGRTQEAQEQDTDLDWIEG